MAKILFVCLGNICRSPAAEAIYAERLGGQDGSFASAGIHDYHEGEWPDPRMLAALKERGYPYKSRSRPVTPDDFYAFDWLLAMDHSNLAALTKMKPSDSEAKVQLIGDFHPSSQGIEVPDPYYGGVDGFYHVIDLLELSIDRFLKQIDLR